MLRLILKPLQYFFIWILCEIRFIFFFVKVSFWSFGVSFSTFSTFSGKLILFERLSPKFFLKNHAQDIFFFYFPNIVICTMKKSSFWLKKPLITTSRALEIKKKSYLLPNQFSKKKNSFQKKYSWNFFFVSFLTNLDAFLCAVVI